MATVVGEAGCDQRLLAGRELSESQRDNDERAVRGLRAELGTVRLRALDVDRIEAGLDRLATGVHGKGRPLSKRTMKPYRERRWCRPSILASPAGCSRRSSSQRRSTCRARDDEASGSSVGGCAPVVAGTRGRASRPCRARDAGDRHPSPCQIVASQSGLRRQSAAHLKRSRDVCPRQTTPIVATVAEDALASPRVTRARHLRERPASSVRRRHRSRRRLSWSPVLPGC